MASIMHKITKQMRIFIHIALTIALLAGSLVAFGQRRLANDQLLWAAELNVDGDLADWGGKLKHDHPSQKLSYEIRNDEQYLFLAIRIIDQERQVQALTHGVSFMLNTDGKRRVGPAIAFPVVDRISFRSIMSGENDNRPEDMRLGALHSVRGIQVSRIGDLLDGLISLDNQYGIQADAIIDQDDALCIEMRLPFSVIAPSEIITGKQIAYNIKVGGAGMGRGPQGQMAPARGANPVSSGYPGSVQGGVFRSSAPREDAGIWGLIQFAASAENKQN